MCVINLLRILISFIQTKAFSAQLIRTMKYLMPYLNSLLAILLSATICLGQEELKNQETRPTDIRNAYWGMSKAELLEKERKLDKFNKPRMEDNMVYFDGQDLGKGYKADIEYKFLAGRLIEINYRVFYESENVVGTCKNVISFRDKVQYANHLFEVLENERELRCFKGWHFNDSTSLRDYTYKPDDDYNCKREGELLVNIMRFANKFQHHQIKLELASIRTRANFIFNEWQNNKDAFIKDLGRKPLCDDEVYNTYFWISFKPRKELQEGISNTAMSIEDLESKPEEESLEDVPSENKSEDSKKRKKKRKKKKEDDKEAPLTPVQEVIEKLPEGAELPENLEEENESKKSKKKKKNKKKRKNKDEEKDN